MTVVNHNIDVWFSMNLHEATDDFGIVLIYAVGIMKQFFCMCVPIPSLCGFYNNKVLM